MNEPFILLGSAPSNHESHNMIVVRGETYSVFVGQEQEISDEIAFSLG
jgi:hypothetical protein